MNKFIKEYGQMILWIIFLVFMLISLSMVFTHGIRYAMVIFVFSLLFLCPPIIKFIQKKTRLKKVVLGMASAGIMLVAMITTNHFSQAKKEEQLKIVQEKKEEREKKLEEQQAEEQKKEEEANNQVLPPPAPKKEPIQQVDSEKEKKISTQQPAVQTKKVTVRASKRNGQYYTPEHPAYNNIAAKNLVVFNSEEAAKKAGYKKAK